MNLYLIDYENVKNAGLMGIDRLDSTDRAVIFYSPNADMISFEMHKTLINSRCDIDFYKIKRGGKNFLDFQLSTYLGYMMKDSNYKSAVIISRDQGFDSLLDFWESNFAESDTGLFRFATIGSFLNYSSELSAASYENDKLEAAALEVESEEIPEPVDEIEAEVFAKEVKEKVSEAEKEHGKAVQGKRGRKKPVQKMPSQTVEAVPIEPSQEQAVHLEENSSHEEEMPSESSLLEKYPPARQKELMESLRKCQRKQDLYITLIKDFGKKKGCEFYHDLKGHFEEIKQLTND